MSTNAAPLAIQPQPENGSRPARFIPFTRCFSCCNGRPCNEATNWEIRDAENCLLCGGSGWVGCVRIETLFVGDICQDMEGHTLTIRRRSAGPGDLVGGVREDGSRASHIRRAAVRVLRRADVAFFLGASK